MLSADLNNYSKPKTAKKINWKKICIGFFAVCIPFSPAFFVLKKNSADTYAYLSPLADSEAKPKQDFEKIYTLGYYLSLSDSFISKATRLANDDDFQTEQEKLAIIFNMNEALGAVNDAVKYYPNKPEPYIFRAELYQKIQQFYPSAKKAAEKDLAIASQLTAQNSSNSSTDDNWQKTVKSASPLDFIPEERAFLASDITIAEPEESDLNLNDNQAEADINALSGKGVIPQGESETIIYSKMVGARDKIYVVPEINYDNNTLSVEAKKSGEWFKISTGEKTSKDIIFKWWIIKSDSQSSIPVNEKITVQNPKTAG